MSLLFRKIRPNPRQYVSSNLKPAGLLTSPPGQRPSHHLYKNGSDQRKLSNGFSVLDKRQNGITAAGPFPIYTGFPIIACIELRGATGFIFSVFLSGGSTSFFSTSRLLPSECICIVRPWPLICALFDFYLCHHFGPIDQRDQTNINVHLQLNHRGHELHQT